jgi:hypothetical protein
MLEEKPPHNVSHQPNRLSPEMPVNLLTLLLDGLATTAVALLGAATLWQAWQIAQYDTAQTDWLAPVSTLLLFHMLTIIIVLARVLKNTRSLLSLMGLSVIMICVPVAAPWLILSLIKPNAKNDATDASCDWHQLTVTEQSLLQHDHTITHSYADAIYILKHAASTQRKFDALNAAKHLPLREAITIYRQAMRDENDEVRLLGVSQFRRIERTLNNELTRAKVQFDNFNTAHQRAESALVLALHYSNHVYLQITDAALQPYYLAQAQHYCRLAFKDSALPQANLLAARIALLLRDSGQAQRILSALPPDILPARQVSPYQAEIAFVQRNYQQVSTILEDLSTPSSKLDKVRRFWQ